MRVVALGGGGRMGRHAVRTALESERVSELIVADLDGERAARAAAQAGPRARAATIDVCDAGALSALLRDADVVMNTVGPFFRFAVPVLRAAIAERCHYLDICDDPEPTLEMLALDALAREAGVIAVVGLGASPGLSNLLAVKAIRALDRADSVIVVFSLDSASTGSALTAVPPTRAPSAALVHAVQQMSGRIPVFEEGRRVERRALRRMDLDYPGLGRRTVWSFGHPESITLPITFSGLRRSTIATFASGSTIPILKCLAGLVEFRLVSVERVAGWLARLEARESGIDDGKERSLEASSLPPLFALASGEKLGQPARVAVALATAPPGGMGPITGIPLGIGVSMLASGQLARLGVAAPEAALDPDVFLDHLAVYCEPRPRRGEGTTVTTHSWSDERLEDAFRSRGSGTGG